MWHLIRILLVLVMSLAVTTYGASPDKPEQSDTDMVFIDPEILANTAPAKSKNSSHRTRRSINVETNTVPSTVYVETLVVVDYLIYKAHDKNSSKVTNYVLSFWNAVDSKFRKFSNPKVRINVVDIIIEKKPGDLFDMKVLRFDKNTYNAGSFLKELSNHFYTAVDPRAQDIIVFMTKVDICSGSSNETGCDLHTAGIAFYNGACVVDHNSKKVDNVAVIEDSGSFRGVLTAAHEVAHLLGAPHDGDPKAIRCKRDAGYIMSIEKKFDKLFQWSQCTTENFYNTLRSDKSSCLYNVPHKDLAAGAPLPGKMMSLDEQCRIENGGGYCCVKTAKACSRLICFDEKENTCNFHSNPAAEGSSCGKNMICLDGKCVSSRS